MAVVFGTQNIDQSTRSLIDDGQTGLASMNPGLRKRGYVKLDDSEADAGKSVIVKTTMIVEQPGGHRVEKTAVAATIDAFNNGSSVAATELLRPNDVSNGALTGDTTYITEVFEYDAANVAQAQADLASGNFSNANNTSSKTNTIRHNNNHEVDYGSGVTAVVEATTGPRAGERFTIQSDGTPAGRNNEGTDFPEGTEFRLKQVQFDPPSGYDGNFSEYQIKVGGVLLNGENTQRTTIPVSSAGTVDVDIPFGVAKIEGLSGQGNINSINVVAKEADEQGFLGTGVSFQPTPGGAQSRSTATVIQEDLDGQGTLSEAEIVRSVISQISTNVSINVNNLEPDETLPDGSLQGTSSGRSITLDNTPVYHIHQDDDFITAWQDIATAMTELAAISTELKGYTESIKNDVAVFKSLGTNSSRGISTKEVLVNTACEGGGLQPAVVIDALQSNGTWDDVLKELGDPLYMPSGERQSDKDKKP